MKLKEIQRADYFSNSETDKARSRYWFKYLLKDRTFKAAVDARFEQSMETM